nr:TerB family tellurite resistance protein [Flavobacterium sp.]
MNNYEERLALLLEMIAFSVIDGKLHEREHLFLTMIAEQLQIPKADFKNLFHQEAYPVVIKSEFERVQQFYRLALLMHSDGVLHEREHVKIHEIGINMGLNPNAVERVLKAMEASPNKMISPKFLLEVFQEQLN